MADHASSRSGRPVPSILAKLLSSTHWLTLRSVQWTMRVIGAAVLVFLTVILVWAFQSRNMGDLEIWHTANLGSEFTRHDYQDNLTLRDYLAMEEELFAELDEEVYQKVDPTRPLRYSRYSPDGPNNPLGFGRNWNRSFELIPDQVKGSALLLHGLTDSPYSLRSVGQVLHDQGFHVVALRLPGHGTIPASLASVTWKDWLAAVRIGARHAAASSEGGPFLLVGYSNGGALSVKYTLEALEHGDLPVPDRLLLFSPAIGVTRFAGIAKWAKLFSFIPYFEKSKWKSLAPEYDPFKYNSFPLQAGDQTFRLTRSLQKDIRKAAAAGRLSAFPPVLTFQSVIDSTVLTGAILEKLYDPLNNPDSELVLFDIDRAKPLQYFLASDPAAILAKVTSDYVLPFRLTIITNEGESSQGIVELTKAAGTPDVIATILGLEWPDGVFSLSHLAIPIPPDDPLYGTAAHGMSEYGLPLGALQLRGEKNLLRISANDYMRLRHNPFFGYVEERIIEAAEKSFRSKP